MIHTNLQDLIADLRNKMGSIVTHFELLSMIDYQPKNIKLNELLIQNTEIAKEAIKEVKDLLKQFENFDENI